MQKRYFLLFFSLFLINLGFSIQENLFVPINEGTGTTAEDKSIYNNDGILNNGDNWGENGLVWDNAYEMDGTDDYIQVTDDSSIQFDNSNDFTISFWLKPLQEYDAGTDEFFILSHEDKENTNDNDGWWIGSPTGADNGIRFATNNGNIQTTTQVFNSGIWYHIVLTHDESETNEDTFYINNTLETNGQADYAGSSGTDLYIGLRQGKSFRLNGIVQDVRLINETINSSVIDWLYNNGSGRTCSINNYPNSCEITNYNITQIYDNTSYSYFLENSTAPLKYNAYNTTNELFEYNLNLIIPEYNINQTIENNQTFLLNLTNYNQRIYNFTATVINPYNSSQNESFNYTVVNTAEYLAMIENDTNTVLNYTIETYNLVNDTYNEVNTIKRFMICYLKQYETVEEYNYYCRDWTPFNKFNPFNVRKAEDIKLNTTAYLMNETLKESEETSFQDIADSCYNYNYTSIMYWTQYPLINYGFMLAKITIDDVYCKGRAIYKIMSSLKYD